MAATGHEEDDTDHYEVLCLPSAEEGAALTIEQIEKAYRTQSRLRHPDKRPDDPSASADFQLLSSSYKLLRDESIRRQFDARLRGRLEAASRAAAAGVKCRKAVSDLEERERAAAAAGHPADPEELAKREAKRMAADIERELAAFRAAKQDSASGTVSTSGHRDKKGGTPQDGVKTDKGKILKVSWDGSADLYGAAKLEEFFQKFGKVEDIVIKTRKSRSKGSAIVVMGSKEAACVQQLMIDCMEDHRTVTIAHTWLAAMAIAVLPIISVVLIILTATKKGRRTVERRGPPVAEGAPLLGVLPAILTRSLQDVISDQYLKLGSVFTLSSLGVKVTFLVGPEVSAHFFHAAESEISIGDVYKVTVPIFGKWVGYDVDHDTRNEQHRFFADTLRPAKLRSHARLMVGEVEEYFAKWGQSGTVDLKREVDDVLLLIASRCLLGKEVRDHMHDEVSSLLRELIGGLHLVSLFFPYLPTPAHRRRDRARARLEEIFSGISRLRRSSSADRGAGDGDDDDDDGRDHGMLQVLGRATFASPGSSAGPQNERVRTDRLTSSAF